MKLRYLISITIMSFLLPIASQAGDRMVGDLSIDEPWARATIGKARSGAAYLTIVNKGMMEDRLVAVETPVARKAEFHSHDMKDGIMKMRPTGPLDVAGHSSLEFQPGGLHVMLMGLEKPLNEGDFFPLTLTFEKSGTITIDVAIRHFAAKQAANGHSAMSHGTHKMADGKSGNAGTMEHHGKSMAHHGARHKSVAIESSVAPSIAMQIAPDADGGWNLHLETSRFRFSPEKAGAGHIDGEGHAHLMVNGKKIARIYGNWFHISDLPVGENRIEVGLYTNDHRAITVDGKPVTAVVTVTAPGS